MRRRDVLRLAASGTGLALLTACGAFPPGQTPVAATSVPVGGAAATTGSVSTTPAAQTTSTPQPQKGGTLRWGVPDAIVTLDGHFQSQGSDSIGLVFDQLTTYDDKLTPQPMLAESWDISADFNQIKLNLRQGVSTTTAANSPATTSNTIFSACAIRRWAPARSRHQSNSSRRSTRRTSTPSS